MVRYIQTYLIGFIALLVTLSLGFSSLEAKTALGGYQKKNGYDLGDTQHNILTSLGNFNQPNKNAPDCCNGRTVEFDLRQLQKKYEKHAADFGVTGNYNTANRQKFAEALETHVKSPDVKPITGTYHKQPVTHYVDPNTGLNVMKGADGKFISGWKLNPAQLENVLKHGGL